ncbi:MAG: IS110 family transposase [Armatimonadetes bacterium]|nr:IS110 family transposase [Armatimonadota bacterium]
MRHIGLDVHKRDTKLCWIYDDTGEISGRATVMTSEVIATIQALPGERCVVLEVGAQSWFLARALMSLPQTQVWVVDAFRARRALEGMRRGTKTDKVDAEGLARLSLEGRAAAMAVWLADPLTHQLRTVSHTRLTLVRQATALQNQIRALLQTEGVTCRSADLMGRKGQQELALLTPTLAPVAAECLIQLRDSLRFVKQQVQVIEQRLTQLVQAHPNGPRLMTIGGCGVVLAGLIIGEIGQITRFSHARHLRSYAGLTPRICQSGARSQLGPLTPGNRNLKYGLVMLAQHFAWSQHFDQTRLKRTYYRCLNRYGPNPAKVALARHLCDIIFAMLRDQTDFAPEVLAA